jgi:type II secretory pathway component PulF
MLAARARLAAMSLSVKDKGRVYAELGKLIQASFPMEKSIEMLADQHRSGSKGRFFRAVQRGFAARLGFSAAVQAYAPHLVSDMERSLLDAGEHSGRLAETCAHLAHYFEVWAKAISEARGAMVYPLVLLHLGIAIPQFTGAMLKAALTKTEIPIVEPILWRVAIVWVILIALHYAWGFITKLAGRSDVVDRILNMVPLIGSARRHWALSRFCQVFHSTLLAGMGIRECLHLAGDGSQSGTIRGGSRRVAKLVEAGEPLAQSLTKSGAFPRMFCNSMMTAEVSGGLDRELTRWTQGETDAAEMAQRRAAEWYPKVFYFVVISYIGYAIVSFMSDYFSEITKGLSN